MALRNNLAAKSLVAAIILAVIAAALFTVLQKWPAPAISGATQPSAIDAIRIGHTATPLLVPLYAALETQGSLSPVIFKSSGDIGYALLAGEVDAGFIEPNKVEKLLDTPAASRFRIAGAVQFPYGAALVVRKDLDLRLGDLNGRIIGASEPDCKLLHQFTADAKRLGALTQNIRYKYMDFDIMLPALESKAVDAVITKGAYAALAESTGHTILYQNWEMTAGDECCPAVLAQIEYFLVVRDLPTEKIHSLIESLRTASDLPVAEQRAAVVRRIRFPEKTLEAFPLAGFIPIQDELRKQLGSRAWKEVGSDAKSEAK